MQKDLRNVWVKRKWVWKAFIGEVSKHFYDEHFYAFLYVSHKKNIREKPPWNDWKFNIHKVTWI